MNIHCSYWAVCFAVAIYMPQAFAEAGRVVPADDAILRSVDPIEGISHVYSDIDMRLRLASKPDGQACGGDVCLENRAFDAEVQVLGQRLTQLAYVIYPELKKRIPNFEFMVSDKKGVGSASNANGKVVIFRSVQNLDLGEEAMAFLVAREMGHVIAHHHSNNAMTKILFSLLSGVLFPAVSILSASSAAAQATSATSVLTSTASTVTSYLGSEVALSRIKPSQLTEADDISITLLETMGFTKAEIAQSLEFIVQNENGEGWEKDLYQSIHYTRKLAGEPTQIIEILGPLLANDVEVETNTGMRSVQQGDIEITRVEIVHAGQADLPDR